MTCETCAVACWDFPNCPDIVDRETAALAEAKGEPHAGAHIAREIGLRNRNRARYGDGGLFDTLDEEPAA